MGSNYVLAVKTNNGKFYGGSIMADNIDEADEMAFDILKKLSKEGYNNISDIEAIDYFNFKQSLPILERLDLYYNLAYYRLSFDDTVSIDFIDKMIKFFEKTEEYEKCSVLLKKKKTAEVDSSYL